MTEEIGVFTPELAREILATFRYLKANGLDIKAGKKKSPLSIPESPIRVRNDDATECPAYGCMQATGTVEVDGQVYFTVEKPADTDGSAGPFLFNSRQPIEPDGYGIAVNRVCTRAITEDDTAGTILAPTTSDWELEENSDGQFIAVGADDIGDDVAWVVRAGGSGGGIKMYQYELLENSLAPATTTAKRKTLAGVYIDDIELEDPLEFMDDQTTGDTGFCFEQGGDFFAIQAPCS